MKLVTKVCLLGLSITLASCSTYDISRWPANKSNNFQNCSASTKQSGDSNLYWSIARGENVDGKFEDICTVDILKLHPTQFAVGYYEVNAKAHDLKKLSDKDLDKYSRQNPEPIVVGPHGDFFIIDHHHLATAMDTAKIKSTYGIVLENWYGADDIQFWTHMRDNNWFYLVDQNGVKRQLSDLTYVVTVRDLKDDPYRSLAGETRCKVESKCASGEWLKQAVPFIEFLWAEHFRRTPAVSSALAKYGTNKFDKVIEAATAEVKRLNGKLPPDESHFSN